jgi:Family of unknown function (DUF6516)
MQMSPATLIAKAKEVRDDGSIIEIVVWQVPEPLEPCTHSYKYRLYFGVSGYCYIRYDNERGKGDHRHVACEEEPYAFESLDQLLTDFQIDIENWSTT